MFSFSWCTLIRLIDRHSEALTEVDYTYLIYISDVLGNVDFCPSWGIEPRPWVSVLKTISTLPQLQTVISYHGWFKFLMSRFSDILTKNVVIFGHSKLQWFLTINDISVTSKTSHKLLGLKITSLLPYKYCSLWSH